MAKQLLGKEVTAALNEKIKANVAELEAKGDLDAAEKIVDEMKQESKLIWSEQEDRNTASSMLK